MRNALGGTQPLSAALLVFGLALPALCEAEEPKAASFILPTPDKQCDQFSRSWVVSSQHTHFSIKVEVRWSAVGGEKEVREEFVLSPGASRALGCASELEIVSAEIMQF